MYKNKTRSHHLIPAFVTLIIITITQLAIASLPLYTFYLVNPATLVIEQ